MSDGITQEPLVRHLVRILLEGQGYNVYLITLIHRLVNLLKKKKNPPKTSPDFPLANLIPLCA